MERFRVILPLKDYLRSKGLPGQFQRCILWNFVDEWIPYFSNMGLPPYPRELWVQESPEYRDAKGLLIMEAKKQREKLLSGLGGVQRIDIETGDELGESSQWQEVVGRARKQGLVIA